MSKDHLEPGDIVANQKQLGLVMRNDGELLVAYPGFDELTVENPEQVLFKATLNDLAQ